MSRMKINIVEVKDFIDDIAKAPEKIFNIVCPDVTGSAGENLSFLMESNIL